MSFWDVVWFIIISFAFVAYLMVLFSILGDLFRVRLQRHSLVKILMKMIGSGQKDAGEGVTMAVQQPKKKKIKVPKVVNGVDTLVEIEVDEERQRRAIVEIRRDPDLDLDPDQQRDGDAGVGIAARGQQALHGTDGSPRNREPRHP